MKEGVANCHDDNFCSFDMYFASCVCYIEEVAGINLKSDYYKLHQHSTKYSKIYLEVIQDSLAILSAEHPENPSMNAGNGEFFLKESFDIDVMTVPFKFRPATQNLPRQLTVDFNVEHIPGL